MDAKPENLELTSSSPPRLRGESTWLFSRNVDLAVFLGSALASMLLLAAIALAALWRRRIDDVELLAATVCVALLGNAFICGVISGPHDRYGARMVWIATFVVLIAAARFLADRYGWLHGRRDRNLSTPSL